MIPKVHRLEDDHFRDHCGVFGIFGHPEAAKLTYLGLYALQHRGQESAGIASSDGAELHFHKSLGLGAGNFHSRRYLASSGRRRPSGTHAIRLRATTP